MSEKKDVGATALVLVKKVERQVDDKERLGEEIADLMVGLYQPGKEWRDVFIPGSTTMEDLALSLRLVNALVLPVRDMFMDRIKQLAIIYDKQKDNGFSFNLVSTLLVQVFDIEESKRWDLPPMGEALRKWCVGVITDLLIDLREKEDASAVSDLLTVDGIVTRADESLTVGGYAETYITSEDAGEIEDAFTNEQRRLIAKEMSRRTKDMAEKLGRK